MNKTFLLAIKIFIIAIFNIIGLAHMLNLLSLPNTFINIIGCLGILIMIIIDYFIINYYFKTKNK